MLTDLDGWDARLADGGAMLLHDAFSAVGTTEAVLRRLWWSRRYRYVGSVRTLVEFRKEPKTWWQATGDAARLGSRLPFFVRMVAIKLARRRGHHRLERSAHARAERAADLMAGDDAALRVLLIVHHDLVTGTGAAGSTIALGGELERRGHHVEVVGLDLLAHRRGATLDALAFPHAVARLVRGRLGRDDLDVVDASTGDLAYLGTEAGSGSAHAPCSRGATASST